MGFAAAEMVATFSSSGDARTHGFDGVWSYRGKTLTWCGKAPTGNLAQTHHERSTLIEVTCKACVATRGDVVTVMVLEPCCELTEPGYDPGPRPYYSRTPSAWPPRCGHPLKRVPTFTEHTTLDTARAEFAKTRGWDSTDGYVFSGAMPPEGERFRIMPVTGSLTSTYGHGAPEEIPFPDVATAALYASQWHEYPDSTRRRHPSLVNIVGDTDTVVRWSSYGVDVGTELSTGALA